MLEELQRRHYSEATISYYLRKVEAFARHFHCPPDRLGPQHIREYQALVTVPLANLLQQIQLAGESAGGNRTFRASCGITLFVEISDWRQAQQIADRWRAKRIHQRLDQFAQRFCPIFRHPG